MVCPTLTTYQTGRERRAEVRPSLLLFGGEVVAMVSRTEQDGVNPSSSGEGVDGDGNRQKRGTGKRTRWAGCQTVEALPCCLLAMW